jgi:hypothetical protein
VRALSSSAGNCIVNQLMSPPSLVSSVRTVVGQRFRLEIRMRTSNVNDNDYDAFDDDDGDDGDNDAGLQMQGYGREAQ